MSAPTLDPKIAPERFPASRAAVCASPWACGNIAEGAEVAWVSTGQPDAAPVLVCGPCLTYHAMSTAQAAEPATVTDPPNGLQLEAALSADELASGQPGEALCTCTRGDRAGFHNAATPPAQRWVHTVCGLPAYAGQAPAAPGSLTVTVDETGEPCAPAGNDVEPGVEVEGDDPADEPQPDDQVVDDVHECECKRVTSRAAFGRTPDGRITHDHCGGLLRPKHMHLAPQPTETDSTTDGEAQTDDRDDDAAGDADRGAADDPGARDGVEARSADGAARAREGSGAGDEGAGEGDRGRDQGRGGPDGPGSVVGDDPQPALSDALEGGASRGVAPRLEGAAEGAPADVGRVREEDRQHEARRGEVAPTWADFLGAPATDDEPSFAWSDFYGSPADVSELEEAAPAAALVGAPVEAPDSDNYLGEFSILELLAEVSRRREVGAQVVGLVVGDPLLGAEPRTMWLNA